MNQVAAGFISGAVAGLFMGLASDLLYRLRVFKSSLIIIDGSFMFRLLNLREHSICSYFAGLCIHLVTSGIFGSIYIIATALLGLEALSFGLVSLYTFLLWLSMLFIALPVAGEGLSGKKSGSLTWIEQLLLHVIFCVIYYLCLRTLLYKS